MVKNQYFLALRQLLRAKTERYCYQNKSDKGSHEKTTCLLRIIKQ